MCGSLICVVTLHFFTVADDLTDLTCIFVYFFILVQLQCRNKKFPTFFLSGIIVFLSFFLIFWATIEKFVYENDQLFPKLSNFVSILFCLSIYNETVEHLCSVIGAIKSNLCNSCCSHGRGNTLVLKKGRQRSKRQNLSMRNLSTKILSTTEF